MANRTPVDAGYFLDEYDGPRFWQHVSFHGGRPYVDDPLSSLTEAAGECWEWQGWTSGEPLKYGRFNVFGRPEQAHRLGLLEFGTKLGHDEVVDHLCRNTLCVRHSHLQAVTQGENVARGRRGRANVTHCRNGHEYTVENTTWRKRGDSRVRYCTRCIQASQHRTYLRSKLRKAS